MILITRPPREARILKNLLTEKGYDSHIFSLSSSIQSQSSIKLKKKAFDMKFKVYISALTEPWWGINAKIIGCSCNRIVGVPPS